MTDAIVSLDALRGEVEHQARRKVFIFTGACLALLAYFVATFVQFDLGAIAQKWSPQRASLLILDTYAYKDHINMRWDEPDVVEASFEGGFRSVYETPPEWMTREGDRTTVSFENGASVVFGPTSVTLANYPGAPQDYVFTLGADGRPDINAPLDALPDWIRVTQNKIEVRPSLYERIQVYRSKVEVFRYEIGWGYFWFDFHSPLAGMGPIGAIQLIASGEQVEEGVSNLSLVVTEFLENEFWQHGTIFFALLETLLMALLGTMIASMVALPLAFMAARNVTPVAGLRFVLRRLFDFLRGIDILIWSLIFLRAFGPGLFTGIFAIAFTDTGTLGKLMSEAIENADNKQREGIQSTGASRAVQHRFGIVPQILPIFISQSLYFLESNTRSAVIIGAMGAGGIGLQFLGALQTGSDFENVAYMAFLVLLLVIMMDMMSSRLRRWLINRA